MSTKKSQNEFRNYSFTEWKCWSQRDQFPDIKKPGIYAIAKSKKALSGKPFTWRKEIAYIGMTASKGGLRARLNQFNDTIHKKALSHGGARRVLCRHKNNCKPLARYLYIAIMTQPPCRRKKDKDKVYGLELFCFAEYISRHKKIPEFNDWARSPKE
jgi:hypothetical protein